MGVLVCELEDNILLDFHKSSHPSKTEFNNCFIIHSKYFEVLPSLPPRRLFSKLWPISRVRFRDSCQILSKNSYHRLSDLFCVFLHFFSSVFVKKIEPFLSRIAVKAIFFSSPLVNKQLGDRAWSITYFEDKSNTSTLSNWWYISPYTYQPWYISPYHLPNIVNTSC